jgi:transposase
MMGPHQRMLLQSQLRHLDFLAQEIAQLDQEVEHRRGPFEEAIQGPDAVPGIGLRGAEEILAELGTDMRRFPTEGHLASWAKVCPGNNQSAGKRKNGHTGPGNPWLHSALVDEAPSEPSWQWSTVFW